MFVQCPSLMRKLRFDVFKRFEAEAELTMQNVSRHQNSEMTMVFLMGTITIIIYFLWENSLEMAIFNSYLVYVWFIYG